MPSKYSCVVSISLVTFFFALTVRAFRENRLKRLLTWKIKRRDIIILLQVCERGAIFYRRCTEGVGTFLSEMVYERVRIWTSGATVRWFCFRDILKALLIPKLQFPYLFYTLKREIPTVSKTYDLKKEAHSGDPPGIVTSIGSIPDHRPRVSSAASNLCILQQVIPHLTSQVSRFPT